jgi:hypothetical protein
MKSSRWVMRQVAGWLIVVMSALCGYDGTAQAQQPIPVTPVQSNSPRTDGQGSSQSQAGSQPSTSNEAGEAYPDAPEAQNAQQGSSQNEKEPQSNGDSKPLGAAAAPYTRPSGVAGSRPAGAVIAPAKQRRVRAILISVGVVVAAGVAIGTVAALSHASPSHPD